jgi:hypothetical protein
LNTPNTVRTARSRYGVAQLDKQEKVIKTLYQARLERKKERLQGKKRLAVL